NRRALGRPLRKDRHNRQSHSAFLIRRCGFIEGGCARSAGSPESQQTRSSGEPRSDSFHVASVGRKMSAFSRGFREMLVAEDRRCNAMNQRRVMCAACPTTGMTVVLALIVVSGRTDLSLKVGKVDVDKRSVQRARRHSFGGGLSMMRSNLKLIGTCLLGMTSVLATRAQAPFPVDGTPLPAIGTVREAPPTAPLPALK